MHGKHEVEEDHEPETKDEGPFPPSEACYASLVEARKAGDHEAEAASAHARNRKGYWGHPRYAVVPAMSFLEDGRAVRWQTVGGMGLVREPIAATEIDRRGHAAVTTTEDEKPATRGRRTTARGVKTLSDLSRLESRHENVGANHCIEWAPVLFRNRRS